MLRRTFSALSLGGRAATPFVTAALQLCQLHHEHRGLHRQLTGEDEETAGLVVDERRAAQIEAQLSALEQEFIERLESLRPLFHASKALHSNRMYSVKLFSALKYFEQTDDPLFQELCKVLGSLRHAKDTGKKTRVWSEATDAGGADDARSPDKAQIDDAVRRALEKVRGGSGPHLRPVTVDYMPGELPAPHPDQVGAELDDPAVAKMSFRNRGHWVLREPGIAPSRNTRRIDAW